MTIAIETGLYDTQSLIMSNRGDPGSVQMQTEYVV